MLFPLVILAAVTGVILYRGLLRMHPSEHTLAPRSFRGLLPFNIGLLYKFIGALQRNELLLFYREICPLGRAWTIEASVLNIKALFTADPQNIEAIFGSKFDDFEKGALWRIGGADFFGRGIFTSDQQRWRLHRKLLRPYSTTISDVKFTAFEESFQNLVLYCKSRAGGGLKEEQDNKSTEGFYCPDLCNSLRRLQLDTTILLLFGKRLHTLFEESHQFSRAMREASTEQAHVFNYISSGIVGGKLLYGKKPLQIAVSIINRFLSKYTEMIMDVRNETQEGNSEPATDFVTELSASDLDKNALRDSVFDIVLASTEASATTMTWILYELSQNPDVMQELAHQVKDTIGFEKSPSASDLKNMAFLNAVINETLRLHPAIPINVRTAASNTTLPSGGGDSGLDPIRVSKGTHVMFSLDALHRRDDIYYEGAPASSFHPRRWLFHKPGKGQYAPFHLGRRPCLGTEHALVQLRYLLCRIVQKFDDVTCTLGDPFVEKASLFNYPPKIITAQFSARKT